MVVATKIQSSQVKRRSSGASLLGLKNHFLKRYASIEQSISDENLSALLLYFALACLNQINKNDLLARSNYLFSLLENFLPAEISAAMPAPTIVTLEKARSFYQSSDLKPDVKESLFKDISNLGFAYQIFSLSIRNKEALPAVQSANKKISRRQLIAFTQLYTPGWVVDFLISNTLKNVDLADFSLLDPACGAGQFLFSAFDLLSSLYERAGCSKEESAKLTQANIYGADIDEKALWVAGLGLVCQSLIKTDNPPEKPLNLFWSGKNKAADFLGSIDRSWPDGHMLRQTYNAVVTNPPYLGRKCLSRELKMSLQEQYPDSSADLCAAFLKRSIEMLRPGGRLGVITQASLLSIPSYQLLRSYLFNNYHFETIVRCGPGVFPLSSGEKIDSVLLLARAPLTDNQDTAQANTQLYDLSSDKDKAQKLKSIANGSADSKVTILLANLTSGLAFGIPPQLLEKLCSFPKLGDIADIRQGLATTDNARFVRYHFDVDPHLIGSVWIPYIKGAGSEKFANDNPFVVKWDNNGEEIKQAVAEAYPYLKGKTAWVVKNEEFYFRPGLCFSFINKSGLAVRRLPPGAIFDVGSSAIFAKPEDEDFLLAYLNSSLISLLAKSINQTINIQVGDLKKLPVFPLSQKLKDKLAILGQQCFLTKQRLIQLQQIDLKPLRKKSSPTSADQLELICTNHESEVGGLSRQLNDLQFEIDNIVLQGVKELDILDMREENCLHDALRFRVRNTQDSVLDPTTFAPRVITALVSSMLGEDQFTERIKVISPDSLAESLGLSNCGIQWLEKRLDRSLEQIFCPSSVRNHKTRIIDISKLAKEPSRYFCLWLDDRQAYLFFSARAVRQNNGEFPKTILQQLHKMEDWTSKDLMRILMEKIL